MDRFYYLIHFQYLGYRFHGWQKQKQLKTVHLMIDKTIKFVLGEAEFKTLGSSRTDAMVSVNLGAFELFLYHKISDEQAFLDQLNFNLPFDIKLLSIKEVDAAFNIIQNPKIKEYIYLFSHGEKAHPFAAPFLVSFKETLDIDLMKRAAAIFEGEHNFVKYCSGSKSEDRNYHRKIIFSAIEENNLYNASFFPKQSYVYRVKSKGFMRNQVRLMVGQLFELGLGKISLQDFEKSVISPDDNFFHYIAPASGLILNDMSFED